MKADELLAQAKDRYVRALISLEQAQAELEAATNKVNDAKVAYEKQSAEVSRLQEQLAEIIRQEEYNQAIDEVDQKDDHQKNENQSKDNQTNDGQENDNQSKDNQTNEGQENDNQSKDNQTNEGQENDNQSNNNHNNDDQPKDNQKSDSQKDENQKQNHTQTTVQTKSNKTENNRLVSSKTADKLPKTGMLSVIPSVFGTMILGFGFILGLGNHRRMKKSKK